MSKKLLITILIILISGLIVLSGVYAGNLFKGKEKGFPPQLKRLNLTDEQKQEIEKILKDLRDKSEEIFKIIKENIEKEKELLSEEVLNEKDLDVVVESQIKNLIDLYSLRKDAYIKIVSILNNDQRKIFPTFIEFSFIKSHYFKPNFINEIIEDFNERIRDYIRIGRKLNLSEEQKEELKMLIRDENIKKYKFIYLLELRFLKKILNLSDEQIEKVKEIFKNEKEKEKEYFEKIRENNKKQREILKSENFNEEELTNLIDEYILIERDIYSLRKNLYFEFLKILTFEQRKNSPTSIFFLKGI